MIMENGSWGISMEKETGYGIFVTDSARGIMCCCKYAKWENGSGESTTAWIKCRLKNEVTDPDHCAKCKECERRVDYERT